MNRHNDRQYVEVFQLLFLDLLGRKLDKRFYVLKGGCNLRFFMKSFRYSEDIDLDAHGISKEKLADAVNGILSSRTFEQLLQVNDIAIEKNSAPKQTETTQRWKVLLRISGFERLLNTKMEFSRRGIGEETAFESVDPLLIRTYDLAPILANHYTPQAAYRQKVEALITRSVPQARDLFDLHLLLASGVDSSLQGFALGHRLDEAVAHALSLSYELFRANIFSYLHGDHQARYASASVWDDMVLQVVAALEKESS